MANIGFKFISLFRQTTNVSTNVQILRNGNFWSTPRNVCEEPRQYEVSRDPEEWKYVVKLLNKETVPPVIKKESYPSGWVPPAENLADQPYYVERTKNHMLPLYIAHEERGQRKVTVLKKIHGDIWRLHQELDKHIEEMCKRKIPSQILECNSTIKFKGDRFHYIEEFLFTKGF